MVLAATILIAGCGGGGLPDADRAMADEFWGNANEFDREAMCEQLDADSATGRAAAYEVIEDRLFEMEMDEAIAKGDETGDIMDTLSPAKTENSSKREARAVEIVKYLRGKC